MKNSTFKNKKNKNYTIKKRNGGEPTINGKKIKIFLENNKTIINEKIKQINELKNRLVDKVKDFLKNNKNKLTIGEKEKLTSIVTNAYNLPTCVTPESMFSLNNIINTLNSTLNGIIERIFPSEPSKKNVNIRGLVYKNITDDNKDDLNNIIVNIDEDYNHYYSNLKDKINDVDDLFARLTIQSANKKIKKENTYSFNQKIDYNEKKIKI